MGVARGRLPVKAEPCELRRLMRCLGCGAPVERWREENKAGYVGRDPKACVTCGAAKRRWWRFVRAVARRDFELSGLRSELARVKRIGDDAIGELLAADAREQALAGALVVSDAAERATLSAALLHYREALRNAAPDVPRSIVETEEAQARALFERNERK